MQFYINIPRLDSLKIPINEDFLGRKVVKKQPSIDEVYSLSSIPGMLQTIN